MSETSSFKHDLHSTGRPFGQLPGTTLIVTHIRPAARHYTDHYTHSHFFMFAKNWTTLLAGPQRLPLKETEVFSWTIPATDKSEKTGRRQLIKHICTAPTTVPETKFQDRKSKINNNKKLTVVMLNRQKKKTETGTSLPFNPPPPTWDKVTQANTCNVVNQTAIDAST